MARQPSLPTHALDCLTHTFVVLTTGVQPSHILLPISRRLDHNGKRSIIETESDWTAK